MRYEISDFVVGIDWAYFSVKAHHIKYRFLIYAWENILRTLRVSRFNAYLVRRRSSCMPEIAKWPTNSVRRLLYE